MIFYYIDSNNGLDTNNGLSLNTALKTLQSLLKRITKFTEDTTIYLYNGLYECDSTIVTQIPSNINVNVVGKGLGTTLKPTEPFGLDNTTIGIKGATLSFSKLILDFISMFKGNNQQNMYNNFNLNNIVIINSRGNIYSSFSPSGSIYTFKNCIAIGDSNLALRCTSGSIRLYNCYGMFGNGWQTSQSKWDIENNIVTSTISLNEKYQIIDNTVSKLIGVYNGNYPWSLPSLIKCNNQYYSINSEFYDTELQLYIPLGTADFNKSFVISDLFNKIKIGETITDVTPVMTSNTGPTPYVVTASSEYSKTFGAWKAFNGTNVNSEDCWITSSGTVTGWIMIDLGNETTVNMINLVSRITKSATDAPKNFTLHGSHDGENFDIIKEFTNEINWVGNESREYMLNSEVTYRYYKINITANNGYSYSSIGNIRLLKRNIVEQFVPIDKFENFTLIFEEEPNTIDMLATKTDSELISASGDISTYIAENIDYFNLNHTRQNNGNIKMAFSLDSGNTWNSYNKTDGFIPLDITIPMKPNLTSEELIYWEIAKNIIIENGISIEDFSEMDWNLVKSKIIRFAYVLIRPEYDDVSEGSKLIWQFDAKGYMKLMQDSEGDMYVYEKDIRYVSAIDSPMIKLTAIV